MIDARRFHVRLTDTKETGDEAYQLLPSRIGSLQGLGGEVREPGRSVQTACTPSESGARSVREIWSSVSLRFASRYGAL